MNWFQTFRIRRLQSLVSFCLVALLLLNRAGSYQRVYAQGQQVTIGTSDGSDIATELSLLVATQLTGFDGDVDNYVYQWFRSAGQQAANYQASQDTDPNTPADQYNVNLNGLNDIGHRFYLQVTDASNHTATSNVIAIGPRRTPTLIHPRAGEEIRVNRPYFNLRNVHHDNHDPPNPPGSYVYDIQIATDAGFNNLVVNGVNVGANIAERTDNNEVTYWQTTTALNTGTTYYWRARAKIADAPGNWSNPVEFTVDNVWSADGETWHWPLDDANARLSGTFKEGIFHQGNLGTRLHGGIDIAVNDVPVRAARTGILFAKGAGSGTMYLRHVAVGRKSQYTHMDNRPNLPLGTYVNQGARLGDADTVGTGSPHLHFGIYNDASGNARVFYNPLAYTPAADNTSPVILHGYFRSDRFLNANDTNIAGTTYIIARTCDPTGGRTDCESQPGHSRLAPYRMQFFVNGQALRDFQFDELASGEHERDYYAYETQGVRGASPPYLMYATWNTGGLADDAGPQTIRVVSHDYNNHQAEHEMTIGPSLSGPAAVNLDSNSRDVTISVENSNEGLEPGITDDEYELTLTAAGIDACFRTGAGCESSTSVTVANGGSEQVTLQLTTNACQVANGSVRVTAASGIVTDIKDTLEIEVTKDCDDDNPCTIDSCDPDTGECSHEPRDCGRSDRCTSRFCSRSEGGCVSRPRAGCDHSDDNESAACAQASAPLLPGEVGVGVAVLFNGFAPEASGFINALQEPNILVDPDFSPDIVGEYPLLVIPSGGLYGLENSAFFRARLEEYANRGGTIIVFDQQHGSHYSVLPGGGVDGYGWAEDNSCTSSSLYIRNYDQILSGFDKALLNSNVDGYFTDLPDDTDVLLWRSKNGQPAMVRYSYGAGTVIASTAYDDWGAANWQTTADAYILNRDLLAWAVDPALLSEFDPGDPVSLPISAINDSDTTAASIELSLLAPGKEIVSQETRSISLTASTTTSVTFDTTAARPLGIWRIDYVLLDADGQTIQGRQPSERFVVKDPHPLSAPVKEVALTVNAPTEHFIAGTDGEFTFTVFNHTDIARTLEVRYGLPHHTWETRDPATYGNFYNLTRTVTVGPNSQEQFIHVFPMRTNDRLFAKLYENGTQKDQAWFQTRKTTASAHAAISTDQREYAPGQTVEMVANVTNLANLEVNLTLDVKVVAPGATIVFSETRPLALSASSSETETFGFALPNDTPNGTFRAQADVRIDNARIGGGVGRFVVPDSPARFDVALPASLPVTAGDLLRATVNNTHAYLSVTGALGLVVTDPDGISTTIAAQPYALAAGQGTTLDFDLSGLPAKLGHYRFDFSAQDQYGQRDWHEAKQVSVSAIVEFDQRTYRIRETLGLSVTTRNNGDFGTTPQVTVAIPDLSFSDVQAISVGAGESSVLIYNLPLPESLPDGFHDVYLEVVVRDTISETDRFLIPESRVLASLDQTDYSAGDTLTVELASVGGVDAPTTATLQLMDRYGLILARRAVSPTVLTNETTSISLTIPAGAVAETYQLSLNGRNTATGAPVTLYRYLNVSGVAAHLSVQTGQPAYFSDEQVEAFADILMTSGDLNDAELNLRICSASSDDGSVSTGPSKITYNVETAPFNWVDISSGGAVVAHGRNTYTQVDLGFPFQFYGVTYTQMYVGSNGYVSFGSGYTDYSNGSIPSGSSPNNAIYALWDDLYPIGGDYGNVYVQQIDATRYVVQWQAVSHYYNTGSLETFQIFLDGSDNSITLQYLDVDNTGSATVGIENSLGSQAIQIAYNQTGVINDDLALRFAPVEVLMPETTYNSETVPFDWVDIASGGAVVARGYNTYSLVDLGFPFQFYGVTYTQLYVGSNGFVSFGSGYTYNANTAIPNTNYPNNAIYALWDYLRPTGGDYGTIYAQQIDATRYVVQWQGVRHYYSSYTETFQIILDGSDNSITLQYLDVNDTGSATVGVENATGSQAIQIAYDQSGVIIDNLALKLTAIEVAVPETNYDSASVSFDWVDIASGGAVVARGYNTYSLVDLGFPFQFYGVTYTQLYVGSNGFVSFGSGYTYNANTAIPNTNYPNNAIYALWDYLRPTGGDYGTIYAQQIDATRYVVQWQGVRHYYSSYTETFQIILDGSDNSITLQYLDVNDTGSATVGVENGDGTQAIQIAYDQSGVVTDGLAIKLTPSSVAVQQTDYADSAVSLDWVDISASGATVAQGDDTYSLVNIGFPFQFYGVTYTQMYVGSNGYVSFGSGYTHNYNYSIPNTSTPNNAIYVLWDDLYPVGGSYGNIYAEQISPTVYVVQWQNVAHYGGGSPETFQVILDGADNSITLQYLDVTSTGGATVGVEDANGTIATQLAYNQSGVIVDGMAFRLTPVVETVQLPSYTTATVPMTWENIAPESGTEVVALGYNTYSLVDLGFPFQFYGITYTQMYVGSNGFLSFGSGYAHNSNYAIPSTSIPNNAIYALWDYLYPIGGDYGQIYTRQISPTVYVVQWEGVAHCCSTTYLETFQVILDGFDNSITLQYEDVSYTNSATVGVEDRYGVQATQVAYNQAGVIIDGAAFKLTPVEQIVQIPTYVTATVPMTWENIAPESGTEIVALARNTYSLVDLGFPFQFYGITHTQMYVGSNGFLSFDSGYTHSSNGPIPSASTPNNVIYALWDDLYPIGGDYGQIYTRQISPTVYVVQWEGVAHCCSTTYPETFQVILDGSDNSITLQYEDVSYTSSATVGVEDRYGVQATQVAYNQSGVIVDGLALKLTPQQQMVLRPSYITATMPINWEDIAPESGTQVVAVGRNTYSQVDLGFSFDFYGRTYSDMYVGSNGFVSFDSGYTHSSNESIPYYNAPNNAIYALWDYLYPNGGDYGQVYARQIDPMRYVVQWQEVSHYYSTGSRETFQVILDGSDNSVTLQYQDVSDAGSATVGVENEYGTRGTQVAYNQSGVIVDGLALRMTAVEEQPPPPPICDPTQPLPLDVMLVIDRSGSMSGQKIVDAKAAAIAFIDFMDLTLDRVGLVSFSSSATLNHGLTQDGDAVKAAINSLYASGGTRIDYGLNVARTELTTNGDPAATPVIILLSDGVSSGDPIGAANAAKAAGIRIISIGLGSDVDENQLRAIASTPEDYYFAPSSIELQNIFESIGSAICRSPLPYDENCGYVLWEETVPVTVATSLNVQELAGPLNVSGRLLLDGRLFAETDQRLAHDNYSFYLHDRDTALTLETDREIYRPGETIYVTGRVTNTSLLTATMDLRVWASNDLLLEQPLTLAPNGGYAYATTMTATASLTTTNVTFVAVASEASAYRVVIVAEPELQASLDAPAVVGREPFPTSVTVTNTGRVPASVDVTIVNVTSDSLTLAPGAVARVEGFLSITQHTTIVAPITGDLNQTLTTLVRFGEAATVAFTPQPVYPVGPVDVPYILTNTGLLSVSFDTDVTLRNDVGEIIATLTIPGNLPLGESQPGTLHFAYLVAGEYTLNYSTPFETGTETFVVLLSEQANLTAVAGAADAATIPVTATVTNTGFQPFSGQVTLQTDFFATSAPVTDLASGQSISLVLPVDVSAVAAGDHPAQLDLLNQAGALVDEAEVTLSVLAADLALTSLPTNLTLPVSTTVTLTFGVTNRGAAAGEGTLSLTFSDVVDEEQRIWLPGGQDGSVDFTFFVPPGLEAKTYQATYVFDGEPGILLLTVEGVDIGVTPSLDKAGYYEGETALLTLHIEEQANRPTLPLYALVRFNDYSEIQPFTLTPLGSVDLTFAVPVSFLGDEKVFYGIYDLSSDRSIHLNTVYLPQLQPDVTVLTDKQVYQPGEMVVATVVTTATGQLDVVAPGFTDTIPLPGTNTSFSFALPTTIARGTYSIDSVPRDCNCLNEDQTIHTPFDVDASEVRITDAHLDQPTCVPGEPNRLDLIVASDRPVTARLLTWLERPDGSSVPAGTEQIVHLAASPANQLAAPITPSTDQNGMHHVGYWLVDPSDADLIYGIGLEACDVGQAIVLSVLTDKPSYVEGESVLTVVALYATHPGPGELALYVDGDTFYSQPVTLIGGFEHREVNLGDGFTDGEHRIEAVLTQAGLTSAAETNFDYHIPLPPPLDLPDLVVQSPFVFSGGTLTRTAALFVTNIGTSEAVATTVALYDGDPNAGSQLLGIAPVPALTAGDGHNATISWSIAGRDGITMPLHAKVDPDDVVSEGREDNNESTGEAKLPPRVEAGPDQAINEGDTVNLVSTTFIGPKALDTYTATVHWEEYVTPTIPIITVIGDIGVLSSSYTYVDDDLFAVFVDVCDPDGICAFDTFDVNVLNVAPAVEAGPDQMVNAGETVSLGPATFADPGVLDNHTAIINWGDGTAEAGEVSESDGAGTISGSHIYGDSGTYTVTVTVTDDDDGVGSDTATITVVTEVPQADLWAVEYRWGEPMPGFRWDPFPLIFEGWMDVRIENRGAGDAFNVTASITYAPINTVMTDPDVTVGDIPAGGSAWSVDTFTTRVDMTIPVDPCEEVFWRIEYDDAYGDHRVIEGVPEFPPGEGPCD